MFTNFFLPSYDVCAPEIFSGFLTWDSTAAARKNDHGHLDWSHTDEQAGLCILQRIARTYHNLWDFSKNPKMKISHIIESGMYEYSICDIRTFPYYYIQLLLMSVGHVVTGSVQQ